jgi:hypothetical protein
MPDFSLKRLMKPFLKVVDPMDRENNSPLPEELAIKFYDGPRELTPERLKLLNEELICPDCRAQERFLGGPEGGAAQNCCCKVCGMEITLPAWNSSERVDRTQSQRFRMYGKPLRPLNCYYFEWMYEGAGTAGFTGGVYYGKDYAEARRVLIQERGDGFYGSPGEAIKGCLLLSPEVAALGTPAICEYFRDVTVCEFHVDMVYPRTVEQILAKLENLGQSNNTPPAPGIPLGLASPEEQFAATYANMTPAQRAIVDQNRAVVQALESGVKKPKPVSDLVRQFDL